MKVRDMIKLLESNGWLYIHHKGSHRKYSHPANPHIVTLAGKPGDDIPTGTLATILRTSGLKESK